jgi:hypothetical protein
MSKRWMDRYLSQPNTPRLDKKSAEFVGRMPKKVYEEWLQSLDEVIALIKKQLQLYEKMRDAAINERGLGDKL